MKIITIGDLHSQDNWKSIDNSVTCYDSIALGDGCFHELVLADGHETKQHSSS
ncbi:MAG: hypothetical protein ACOYNC_12495 [Bacteroidales bacterium]